MSLSHRNGQPKKLVLKSFEAKSQSTRDASEDAWHKLRNAIKAIFGEHRTADSLEELYQAAENMCLQKMSETLYRRLFEQFEEHVIGIKATFVREEWATPESFLKYLKNVWETYCGQIVLIRSIFLYLDRSYVMQSPTLLSIWDMALDLFRQRIMLVESVQIRTKSSIMTLIDTDRREHEIGAEERNLLKAVVRMLLDLQLYKTVLEPAVVSESKRFYTSESAEHMLRIDTSVTLAAMTEYLSHVATRIREEQDRCSSLGYLDIGSRKQLVGIVEDKLVKQNVASLLKEGFALLMDNNRIEDLRLLFDLMSRVQALDLLRLKFVEYIKAKGAVIVTEEDKDKDDSMVQSLLDFKSRIDNVLQQSLMKNESFTHAVKEAFEHFINMRKEKPAELIAKHIDALMKSSKRDEGEIESALDQCLILFRYVQGKDTFEAFYKNDLARRLLLNKSASIDSEKSMLNKLKQECGAQFTANLEAMFKDIDVSRSLMSRFKSKTMPLDLNVNVLTSAIWPTHRQITVTLPDELVKCINEFDTFYKKNHKGRQLTWQHTLSSCAVKAEFPKGQKELHMSLFQTVILLHFNDHKMLSYNELKAATGLEDQELARNLQSLACGKVRVLTKIPKGKDVEKTDRFEVNDTFENNLTRIKINTIQLKETKEEQKETSDKVAQDRHNIIDAAVVRIMKTRKRLDHNSLLTELIPQLRFPITGTDMKRRIDNLIEREFLERDPNNRSMYIYLP